ncbi:hypothetical protein GCM10011515_05200 [Tsuneonella deserti]|uniref:GDT1 family protein n=1 Tax=Tsuneonella deserti TaxID=2035528 RepID=A0ABQ1S3R1_9SPHN|nr:hypothetical protein [Tsuneonella deserti]GGD88484.1 hypothetical protein GCM10011515_05200 [Tsuneonella deserti]
MSAFLFALVAVIAVSLGGRDQMLVARLAERLGRGGPLLAVGVLSSIASAFAMAAAGLTLTLILPGPAADMLVALALLIAAVELAWPRAATLPEEPTQSLAAIFIVLAARQVGDAARFLVLALAAGGPAWLAGAGGATGGIVALCLGIAMGDEIRDWPLRLIRRVMAAVLAIVALVIGLASRGIIG